MATSKQGKLRKLLNENDIDDSAFGTEIEEYKG